MTVNYGILQIGGLANKDGIQPRRLEHPCAEALGVRGRRWALACPLGIPREEASWELFCGLPELKVKVRREDCRWGRAAFPGTMQWLLGEEEEGASLELLLPSCFSLNGEVFLSRPWRS